MHRVTWVLAISLVTMRSICATAIAAELPPPAERPVDFAKDIEPLFRRACHSCHGPEKQRNGYRLDIREIALTGGEAYAPNILPGNSAKSPLVEFLTGDSDLTMPPEGPRLTPEEIGLVRAWIDQGAQWPAERAGKVVDKADWWAFRPLTRPAVPAGAMHPLDTFLAAKRQAFKLPTAPPADRRTLIRRLTFDLTGLPPTPAAVAAFVADDRPDAYERLVDELLASSNYGERQARLWMDAIHFAETHGHDQDRIREHAWPYRDYLIAAFNADKPWDRMIEEQIAGDALFPDEPQAAVALGFLAAGPWDESSLRDIREDTLDRQIARYLDRDDMLGTVMHNITSLTVQCARCHDHKFDPISQADYYAMQAVFAGVERANRRYDADPAIHRQRNDLTARKQAIDRGDAALVALFATEAGRAKIAAWEARQATSPAWQPLEFVAAESAHGATLRRLDDGSVLSAGARPERDDYTVNLRMPAGKLTAFRLEVLTHESLTLRGPGRQENGNLHLAEIQLFVGEQPVELCHPTADFNQQDWEIGKSLDNNPKTAWGIYPQVGEDHEAVFELRRPLEFSAPQVLRFVLWQRHGTGHLIGRLRITATSQGPPIGPEAVPAEIAAVLRTPDAQRTAEQWKTLGLFVERDEVDRSLRALPNASLIYAAASDFQPDGGLKPPPGPRPVHVLHRGDIRQPRDAAMPGAPSFVSELAPRFELPVDANESARRAALAHWLTDRRNPLTWRSIVNRIWQQHFERGLAAMPNDFGHMGEPPSHPELLEWLAVEFRDGGQSLKQLHRLIVTSEAYQQSSRVAPSDGPLPSTMDADNRYLWRAPRKRLDAESIRDSVLAISGRLDLRMGGPSDRQFDLQPGIHVTPQVDYTKFNLDSPAGQRRSVYRFLFRTLPDPFMEALDCPAGDQFAPLRNNGVTVQQALAMWNDAFILRHCEHLAARLQREAKTTAARVDLACEIVYSRPPAADELAELTAYAEKHGWANFCRLLLNSNEFVFVD
jgi:mono/diheme cytochrome c family protein